MKKDFLNDIYAFSKFVRQARNLEQGLKVIGQMKKLGIKPNAVTFTSLIPLCKTLQEGFEILEKMEKEGCQADIRTFMVLLKKVTSKKDIEAVEKERKEKKLKEGAIYKEYRDKLYNWHK
ncbi:MAG: hypothetical protein HZA01_04450 [Nitrospinae bacterium]|nr:hypothetical protein [Nitrospinota bacterium]